MPLSAPVPGAGRQVNSRPNRGRRGTRPRWSRPRVELVVQVNGKVRDRVRLSAAADQAAHEAGRARQPEDPGPPRRPDRAQSDRDSKQTREHRRRLN